MDRRFTSLLLVTLAPGLLALSGCSGDEHMSSLGLSPPSANSDVRIATADVSIDGRSVENATIAPGSGTSTLFTVSLADPADGTRIRRMQMDYPVHSSMGMMGSRSSVDCYDDGTHGDAVAGDGTYSYLDMDDHIGPHAEDCTQGEYVYSFHGTDMAGMHTNTVSCRISVREP